MLVAEDEPRHARALAGFLDPAGFEVVVARDTEAADNVIERRPVRALVAELHTPRVDGLGLLRRALRRDPGICAVLIARDTGVAAAVAAMREGAHDVLVPPILREQLLAVLKRGIEHQELAARVAGLERQLDERRRLERLTGTSRAIHRVMEQVTSVASTRAAVLVEGEPGTGKRLVAQAIHRLSPRKDERFVWANVAVAGERLIEGELFGYERGATGAGLVRPGRFELADRGTLYLDEIAGIPAGTQVRLLRALQDQSFERLGGTRTLRSDVRLIASTSRDLEAEVRAGRFREDLFLRVSVVRIRMPALRERREDIPLLVQDFVRELSERHGRHVTGISPGALDALARHAWPGNVGELKSAVEGMIVGVAERRRLELSDVPRALKGKAPREGTLAISVGMTMDEAERQLIEATLRTVAGDKPRAAAMLGIGLRTLYRKLERYGLR